MDSNVNGNNDSGAEKEKEAIEVLPLSSQSDFDGSNVQVNQYKTVPQSSGSDVDSMNQALLTGTALNSSSSGNFEPEATGGATGGAASAPTPARTRTPTLGEPPEEGAV